MYSVYIHAFPNEKVYVGITSRPVEYRWNNGNNYVRCPAVYRAIQKYGWENIKHNVVRIVETKEEAEQLERLFIFKYGSNDKRFGYNIMSGGDARGNLPYESRKRIGEKNKKHWEESPVLKQQASERMKKRMADPEYRKKVFDALNAADSFTGKNKKRVVQMDVDGNVIKIWNGLIDVQRSGIATRQAISLCCLGKLKTVKGYRWEFYVSSVNT